MTYKKTFGFIILNILFDIAEFGAAWFLIKLLTGDLILATVLTVVLVIIMIVFQVMSKFLIKSTFTSEDSGKLKNRQKVTEAFNEICGKIEDSLNVSGLELIVTPGRSVDVKTGYTPALNFSNIIVVADEANKHFIKGVIAHEAGHAISGLSGYTFLDIRITHFISSFFRMGIVALLNVKKAKALCSILSYPMLAIYCILMIPDFISVVPFMRADEYDANDFAVTLGYGEEIRCFYFELKQKSDKKDRLLDIMHPSFDDLIERIDNKMELDDAERPVYSVGKNIYYVEASEKASPNVLFRFYEYRSKITTDGYYKYMLGTLYEKGSGTVRDIEKAKECYTEARSKGINAALLQLSSIYEAEDDIENAYNTLKEYAMNDTESTRVSYKDRLEKLAVGYFEGVYNCTMQSPAGKTSGFEIWKARLSEDRSFIFVISANDEYNIIRGSYTIRTGDATVIEVNISMDGEHNVTFTSDEITTRDYITFTGAIGKYTLILTHDSQADNNDKKDDGAEKEEEIETTEKTEVTSDNGEVNE